MSPRTAPARGRARRLAGVLAACFALAPCVAAAQDVIETAVGLQRRLQYAEATRLLTEALPDLRGEPRARAALMLAALSSDHKEARRLLRDAQQAAPGGELQRRAEIELARLDFARGNYNSVRSRLDAYDDAEARLLVAASWVALEDAPQAEAVLRELPPTPRTQLLRCWAARRRGDVATALATLTTLATAGGDFLPTVLLWKAECEVALERPQEAATTASELQRRFPTAPEMALLEPTLQALRLPRAATRSTVPPSAPVVLLQLGVFETRANALRLRDKVPAELGTVRVDEIDRNGRHLYRVSLGPFESAAVATDFARTRLDPRSLEWRLVTAGPP